MKQFLADDFLLESKSAETLYHDYAKDLPIIDYHNHLPPKEIANDRTFENISQVWLAGDHYKWRAMRAFGINEKYITGSASDEEKFYKWANTVPHTLRNPLYHWTHLELNRYFGINELLSGTSAPSIYSQTRSSLQQNGFSVRGLLNKMKVEVICTTDDPTNDLSHHQRLGTEGFEIKVLPTFRPDAAMAVENAVKFNQYVDRLTKISNKEIKTYEDYLDVLKSRHDFFHKMGCRLSDHGLSSIDVASFTEKKINKIFERLRSGQELSPKQASRIRYALLIELAKMDHAKGWTQQFHLGALRNTNQRMLSELGPDTGFDSIGDFPQAMGLFKFLDTLDSTDQLAKTIVYNLNPADNEVIAAMMGNYNDGSIKGKMQFGSGWWYLDQLDGMEKQLNTLSNIGLLSCFVGMLTDSRSFLSFPRHEYFRRLLCNLLGNDIEKGLMPNDMELVGQTVKNICYYNAKEYFNF